MCTHNICLYKEADKKYTGCNLKTMELRDCTLTGVCAVIRSNRVVEIQHCRNIQLYYDLRVHVCMHACVCVCMYYSFKFFLMKLFFFF